MWRKSKKRNSRKLHRLFGFGGATVHTAHTTSLLLTQNVCLISINCSTVPREGAYVHGMFMEGARWDTQSGIIVESRLKELFPPMPVINIRVSWMHHIHYNNVIHFPIKICIPHLPFSRFRQLHKTSRIYVICISARCIKLVHVDQLMCGRLI